VQTNQPDRIADLLEEAASRIDMLENMLIANSLLEVAERTGGEDDAIAASDAVSAAIKQWRALRLADNNGQTK
jgi:hypothetical protein